MADPVSLMRAASNTGKLANTVKGMWEERTKLRADGNGQAWDLILRAQMDEVFLVLAHLGEAILPLGVFNKDYYLQTLGDVKASLASCGNEMLVMAWEELDAELQYCCTAGFSFCAHFSPTPVYRGFGACVLSDWDWACPDMAYLEEKARKKAIRTVYGVKQKTDPQPTRSVFQDFDQAIQILQVKPLSFFVKRPPVSGFTEQPRFHARAKKEVKNDFDLLEDWLHQVVRRGHPAPSGTRITNWGFPYATWTSESNYHILKSEKDCETLMLNQMDPGRLLHAFVCKRAASLDEHSMFLLLPRSAAESLLVWLEGLPNMNHRIIAWSDLDTESFEKKISKSLRKKIGQHPLPIKYAVRHPNASARPELHVSESSPAVLEHPNTVSPPPYSPIHRANGVANAPHHPQRERASTVPVAELGAPETQEMPAGDDATRLSRPVSNAQTSIPGLKSIHTLRRKPSDIAAGTVASNTALATVTTRHPTVLRPGNKSRSSANWMLEDGEAKARDAAANTNEPVVAELPAPEVPTRKPVPSVAVQPPLDCAELPVVSSESVAESKKSEVPKPEPLAMNRSPSSSTEQAATQTSPSQPDTVASADNNYLELLNRVARGEISPQELSQMLASGGVGSGIPSSLQPGRPASTSVSESTTGEVDKTQTRKAEPLPYPESPSDAKQT